MLCWRCKLIHDVIFLIAAFSSLDISLSRMNVLDLQPLEISMLVNFMNAFFKSAATQVFIVPTSILFES